MQIVSTGDSLHEISGPDFWEKYQFVLCWISPQSGYGYDTSIRDRQVK